MSRITEILKQKKQKKKIVSRLLAEALPDITGADPEAYVMTKTGQPGSWSRSDSARREFFTKRFVAMRDVLKFDKDLKMYRYSFADIRAELSIYLINQTVLFLQARCKQNHHRFL